MAFYRYKVIQNSKKNETVIEAGSEADALRILNQRNLTVVKFLGESDSAQPPGTPRISFSRKGKFNIYDFTDRLAPLLEAGIPLEQTLAIIEQGMKNNSGGLAVVQELRRGLHEGKSFSSLLKARETLFPPLFASLIETGEETGSLPEVAKELQRFMKDSKEFKEFVITSSIYPSIIVLVTLTMIVLLFTFFIPRFARLFKDAGKDLPFMTQVMLETGNFMQAVWWLWPLLILLGIVLWKRSRKTGALKAWKDKNVLRIPLAGRIVEGVQVSRFIRTLSIMVRNDVGIIKAVNISSRILQNGVIADSFSSVSAELRAGHKLSVALGKSPYMPDGAPSMLRIAEESGDVAQMLTRIAENSEGQVKTQLKRLLTALEPAIILVLAGFIALVVVAVFQAIMKMNSI